MMRATVSSLTTTTLCVLIQGNPVFVTNGVFRAKLMISLLFFRDVKK